jgi:peptidoglycan/LPS O-acetylase OafA/YrhL
VIGFFVLSGFCIQLSCRRLAAQDGFILTRYLVHRATRILPLYYACLFGTLLVEAVLASGYTRVSMWSEGLTSFGFAMQLLVVQGISVTFGSYAASWSITNEVAYYLAWGVALAAWREPGRAIRHSAMIVGTLGGLCFAAYRALGLPRDLVVYGDAIWLALPWLLGVWTAERYSSLTASRRITQLCAVWPALLAAVVGAEAAGFSARFGNIILGVPFAMLLVRAGASGTTHLSKRSSRLLGDLSYPLYLLHGPLLILGASVFLARYRIDDWFTRTFVLVVAALAPALAVGVPVERWLMRWRAAYLRSASRDASATAIHQGPRPIFAPRRAI